MHAKCLYEYSQKCHDFVRGPLYACIWECVLKISSMNTYSLSVNGKKKRKRIWTYNHKSKEDIKSFFNSSDSQVKHVHCSLQFLNMPTKKDIKINSG